MKRRRFRKSTVILLGFTLYSVIGITREEAIRLDQRWGGVPEEAKQ